MFETIQIAPPDPILGLTEAFKQDPNPAKINLSVGVYQDESGETPILQSVKQAEHLLVAEEKSKGYLGIAGHPTFAAEVQKLVFGSDLNPRQVATVQTPGGTGALRIAAELVRRHFPHARIWCSQPTWANHPQVFQSAGLEVQFYPYLDGTGHGLDLPAMLQELKDARPGDVVCLHACCHNPSGIDPQADQWREIAALLQDRQLLPLMDFAYQGFGTGLSEDAEGIRILMDAGLELLVCSSYSKNFGLYAERVGALSALAHTEPAAAATLSQLKTTIRANYSNPPKHGAAVVARVLTDPELRALWEGEVESMRARIQRMRQLFIDTLRAKGVQRDFSFLLGQRGMFSFSGLNPMQVDELRKKHAVYIVGSGRINVAGMTRANMGPLCDAIAQVLEGT
jgi:aspartate aminotransferase